MILTLDLGTKTGYAVIENRKLIESGFENFADHKFSGAGMRYLKFKKWLHHSYCEVDAIYFEAVRRHIGTDAAHMYGGFMSHLTCFCEEYSIPHDGVPVGTIKKHITGKGNASKDDVLKAVNKKYNINVVDDNESDAIALASYVIHNIKLF